MDFKKHLTSIGKTQPRDDQEPRPQWPETSALQRTATTDLIVVLQPGQCRPWKFHDRNRNDLNEETCGDLLASIQRRRQNEEPIIVRTVDEPGCRYEIIAGVRRHWCVMTLTQKGVKEVSLRGIVRDDLDDKEAFEICDLENRHREDISLLERARSYTRVLKELYETEQELADSLQISRHTLRRYRMVARVQPEIVECFANASDITMRAAEAITSAQKSKTHTTAMVERAQKLKRIQVGRRKRGKEPMDAHGVVGYLLQTTHRGPADKQERYIKDDDGRLIARVTQHQQRNHPVVRIRLPKESTGIPDLIEKTAEMLQKWHGSQEHQEADGT